MYQII